MAFDAAQQSALQFFCENHKAVVHTPALFTAKYRILAEQICADALYFPHGQLNARVVFGYHGLVSDAQRVIEMVLRANGWVPAMDVPRLNCWKRNEKKLTLEFTQTVTISTAQHLWSGHPHAIYVDGYPFVVRLDLLLSMRKPVQFIRMLANLRRVRGGGGDGGKPRIELHDEWPVLTLVVPSLLHCIITCIVLHRKQFHDDHVALLPEELRDAISREECYHSAKTSMNIVA